MEQVNFDGSTTQQWKITRNSSNGTYSIMNMGSGGSYPNMKIQCIGGYEYSGGYMCIYSNSSATVHNSCVIAPASSGAFKLLLHCGNFMHALRIRDSAPQYLVQQTYTQDTDYADEWVLEEAGSAIIKGKIYKIKNYANNLVLDTDGQQVTNSTIYIDTATSNNKAQEWYAIPGPNGSTRFRNMHSEGRKYLHTKTTTPNPTDVTIKTYGDSTSARWFTVYLGSSLFKLINNDIFNGESYRRGMDPKVRSSAKTQVEVYIDPTQTGGELSDYMKWSFQPIYALGDRPGYYETSLYTSFSPGQCTWYAHGRAKEKTNVTITFSDTSGLKE